MRGNLTKEQIAEIRKIYIAEMQKNYNAKMLEIESTPKAERYQYNNIDEMILPAVKLLNEKGYFTRGCCSGHFGKNIKTYIQFDREIKQEDFPNIPKGFQDGILQLIDFRPLTEQEIESRRVSAVDNVSIYEISAEETGGTGYNGFLSILKANAALLEWALQLPERKPN